MSPDITDTVELSRRLLEILSKSDPTEAGEELKKLKDELDKRSASPHFKGSSLIQFFH